jgi:hypothetical protein
MLSRMSRRFLSRKNSRTCSPPVALIFNALAIARNIPPISLTGGKRDEPRAVHELLDESLRGLQRQTGLAHASLSPTKADEAAIGICQPDAYLRQFRFAPDERRGADRQVVQGHILRVADLLVERGRLSGGFDAQLFFENAAARLILRERGGALTRAGEGRHTLTMRLFAPRVEGEQAGGGFERGGIVRAADLDFSKAVQGLQGEFAQAGAFGQHPIFEVGRVADVEAFEEVAAVEAQGICQNNRARSKSERRSGTEGGVEFN